MNYLIKLSVSIVTGIWLCMGNAFAVEIESPQAYESLQNCMADARDVVDNGSYAAYCMDTYYLAVKREKDEKKLSPILEEND